ncbi:ribonuclease S-F11-like [Tripterygium wilfordii]|uniref:ribonuclease S-F11-like n=1 Tax=Tripterygium wilfordii TaxID=458696 RepID=UPI0018F81303|nr:ribonuclease S-F11-like [Tripterygium wilfordii]
MGGKSSVGSAIFCILATTIVLLPLCADARRRGEYEYYKIVFRWAESFCRENLYTCHLPVPDYFVIQSGTLLQPILQEMDRYWPNIYKFNENLLSRTQWNEKTWKYEWKEHGKCHEHPNNPFYYFNTAITFARQFRVKRILENAGITPSDEYGYEASAIKQHLGVDIQIFCKEDSDGLTLHITLVMDMCNGDLTVTIDIARLTMHDEMIKDTKTSRHLSICNAGLIFATRHVYLTETAC